MQYRQTDWPRKAGIMLPLASLPSRYGVGDMGPCAYQFVDLLARSGAAYWQILPLNPLGYGNSPYQPYSSFAGDPLYISLEKLYEDGLLAQPPGPFREAESQIAYDTVRAYKERALRLAFERFTPTQEYAAFAALPWVHTYAVFITFGRQHQMRTWNQWPVAYRDWPYNPDAIDIAPYREEIRFETFLQYLFYTQWLHLKQYANEKGIEIIGDIPIYVGINSQEVWAGRENFLLDEQGNLTFVAGVPPDYFSQTGQRWGNPIYDWQHIRKDGFAFWLDRLRYSARLFDIIRIDHFRGFDTYWEIPQSCPTAVEGQWREAPGYALFDAVMQNIPGIRIIAEDLGMLRDEVYRLRDHYHFPGMKVLQFTFVPGKKVDTSPGKQCMVVYTGTHDNQTTLGWYRSLPLSKRLAARKSLLLGGLRGGSIVQRFVRLALRDGAQTAIIPICDVLGLDDSARINIPGTVGHPNWVWKMADFTALEAALPAFQKAVEDSARG